MARITIEVDSKGAVKGVKDLEGAIDKADVELVKFEKDAKKTGKTLQNSFSKRVSGGIAGLFAGFAVTSTVTGLIRIADEMTSVNARVKIATESTQAYNIAQEQLFRISQATGTQLAANAATFSRLNPVVKIAGGNLQDTLDIVETLNKAFVANGSSTVEAASVAVQFAQALGSGVLQGDELRSILEANSFFARQLADALGVNVGQLKSMGAEGKLTAEAIVKAFPKIKTAVDDVFDDLPITVSRALQEVSNAVKRSIGIIDSQQGATNSLATSIQAVARSIENNQKSINQFAEGLAVVSRIGIETFSGLSKIIGISAGNVVYWASFIQQGFESAFLVIELIATKAFYNIAKSSNDAVISAINLLNKLPKVNIEVPSGSIKALDVLNNKIKETGAEILAIDAKYTAYRKSVKDQAVEQAKALADQVKGINKVLKPVKETTKEQQKTETVIKKVNGVWISTLKTVTASTKKTGEEVSKVRSKWDGEADRIVKNNKKIQDSIDKITESIRRMGGPNLSAAAISGNVQARAGGGPVTAGRPYIVGENEPELFVPRQSGRIMNQSQIADSKSQGSVDVNFNMGGDTFRGSMPKDDLARLQRKNELNRRFASA